MTQAERRHDRLAVRLSLIIGRLVAGRNSERDAACRRVRGVGSHSAAGFS